MPLKNDIIERIRNNDPTLTSLSLHNQISDAEVQELSEALKMNHTLTSLNLSANQIRAAGAQALSAILKTNHILTSLNLGWNQIGDAGAEALSEVLKTKHTLTSLSLSSNQIGNAGLQALCASLSNNSSLISLDLSGNGIANSGARILCSGLKNNQTLTSLNVSSNGIIGVTELCELLDVNHSLTELIFANNKAAPYSEAELNKRIEYNKTFIYRFLSFVEQGSLGDIKIMLKSVSIHCVDENGMNGLHLAAERGHLPVVRFLIENGINVNHKNRKNQTALDLAKIHKQTAVVDYLTSLTSPSVQTATTPSLSSTAAAAVSVVATATSVLSSNTLLAKQTEVPAAATSSPATSFASALSTSVTSAAAASSSLLPQFQQISWLELQINPDPIGLGGFGSVYKVTWHGIAVAVKQLHLQALDAATKKTFEQEAHIMASCQFPYLVRLYGICTEPQRNALVMEYLAKGSLFSLLHNQDELLSWPLRWNMAIQIGRGLSYLHKKEIIHRDLKSHNVFVDADYTAKIGDFGLAKIKLASSVSTTAHANKTAGSTRWKAPELFKPKASLTKASDVYSYGMVMWELAARMLPFSQTLDEGEVREWLKEGTQEDIPVDCPAPLATIIKDCWQASSETRPSAEAVVSHLITNTPQADTQKKPAEKAWHFNADVKASAEAKEKDYTLLPAGLDDVNKVLQFYQHHRVPGYDIKRVQVIYNPTMNRGFELRMRMLQGRAGNAGFAPKWQQEANAAWRTTINTLWNNLAAPYTDSEFPDVKLLPLWHGTRAEHMESLFTTGYANLATTDSGFFGKGIYSTHEAEYAYRVYSKGALIINWVASFSAYPVIDGDMNKLIGGANYQNYDAHFVPVVPASANAHEISYYPCKPNQAHTYTEVVVFESAQCLPRYLVELQPSLPASLPAVAAASAAASIVQAHSLFSQQNQQVNHQLLALEKAAEHAYRHYLSKQFTAPGGEDREYTFQDVTIQRPNHGLAHTLRCVFYAPLVVEAYNAYHPTQLISKDDLESIQIALIFHVAGRRNDMSSAENPALYQEARAASAQAFLDYVAKEMPIKFTENKQQFYAEAIQRLSGYGEENSIHLIINFCHYLDLPRCLSQEVCAGIYNAYISYVGSDAVNQLKQYAEQCLLATGNRIIGKANYQGNVFVDVSRQTKLCMVKIQQAIQTVQSTIQQAPHLIN